jgi:plastocyanin
MVHRLAGRHRDQALHVQEGRAMHFTRLVALIGLAAVCACGGDSPTGTDGNNNGGPPTPPPPVANTTDVSITDYKFTDANVTIKVGQSVRWTNDGGTSHHVVSDDGTTFDLGNLGAPGTDIYGTPTSGKSATVKFSTAGTYKYHCANHPPSGYPNFVGTITVTP